MCASTTARRRCENAHSQARLHLGEQLGVLALALARATGASSITGVSAGSASTASTIWLTVCAARGLTVLRR